MDSSDTTSWLPGIQVTSSVVVWLERGMGRQRERCRVRDGGGKETQRQRGRPRDTERGTERETDAERYTETERDTERYRDRHTETEIDTETD